MRPILLVVAALSVLLSGCPSLEPLDFPEGCQPLYAGGECYLPYPSDAFAVADDSMPSGRRIEIPESATTYTPPPEKFSTNVHEFWVPDGFSTNPAIVFVLPGPKDKSQAQQIFGDYDATTEIDHVTTLIDADTGAFIPHFVDFDPRAEGEFREAVILRPMTALLENHRYVVAVHDWRNKDSEQLVKPPEGFRRLRDGQTSQDPDLEALVDRYETDIFAVTEAAGIDRFSLQLAWDFTTGTDEHVLRDMLAAKQIADAALALAEPVVEIEAVFDDDPIGWRVIKGNVIAPLVMENNRPRARLNRDEDGDLTQNGMTPVPFTMVVPYSVRDQYGPGHTLLFGHGFFGSRSEVENGRTPPVLDALGAATISIDWWGMSSADVGAVISTVGGDVSQSLLFTERVPQAMVNWLTVIAALKGPFRDLDAFKRPTDEAAPGVSEDPQNPGQTNAGALLYNPDRFDYLGISLGHILGGVLTSLTPDIERIVFNVGGAGFSHMMYRAQPFLGFLFVLNFSVPDRLDQQKLAAALQTGLDRIDPARYAPYLQNRDFPLGDPARSEQKRVLMQFGKGDTQVPNFASLLHARLLGLPVLSPNPLQAWGLSAQEPPLDGSGVSIWDMDVDDAFYKDMYPLDEATIVHDDLRLSPEVQEQMRHFLDTGEIIHPCAQPCVVSPP